MFERQTEGSVSCPSCNKIVSVTAKICPHCGRHNPGIWGYRRSLQRLGNDFGVIPIITWGCIALYVASLAMDPTAIGFGGGGTGIGAFGNFLSPSGRSTFILGSTGAIPVFALGRWWTVLSSAWLHGSLLHILFNLLWIRHLAPSVAKFYGAGRLTILYIVAAVTGSVLTSLAGTGLLPLPSIFQGAEFAIGASGGVFGLFGAMLSYGQTMKDPAIRQAGLAYALIGFVYGLLVPRVDNWGHFGGFLGGYLVTKLPWFNPHKREGHFHLIAAIALLAASFLSVIASVVHAYIFIGGF
ncbi:MAG: rhomboid family intramembrane serine protease [Cyanobacteria bacterium P01_E01_bin.42]